jgi:hypothetical protein
MNENVQVLVNGATDQALLVTPEIIIPPPKPEVNGTLIAHCGAEFITRADLLHLPCPEATKSWKPIPHIEIVNAIIETLGYRHLNVVREEYAATPDGNKLFGVMEIDVSFTGLRFVLGLRNSNDKSLRLAITVGYRVFVCDNLSFRGDFSPLLTKHTHNVQLLDSVSIAVDRIQRQWPAITEEIDRWKNRTISDREAKEILYNAFIERKLKAPSKLIHEAHKHYFQPQYEDFEDRTFWSLSNAFTSALKTLSPVNQLQGAGKVGAFLASYW